MAAVYRILTRLADSLEGGFGFGSRPGLDSSHSSQMIRSQQDLDAIRIRLSAQLLDLRRQLDAYDDVDELRNQLDEMLAEVQVDR